MRQLRIFPRAPYRSLQSSLQNRPLRLAGMACFASCDYLSLCFRDNKIANITVSRMTKEPDSGKVSFLKLPSTKSR